MPGQHKIWERQSTWNVFNQLTTRKTNYWKLFPDKRKQNIILINFNKKTETENHNFSFQEDFKSILIDLKSPKQNVTLSFYSPQEAKKACKLIRDRFGITEASQLKFWDNGLLFKKTCCLSQVDEWIKDVDYDGDGQLSLEEFKFSLAGNLNQIWCCHARTLQ